MPQHRIDLEWPTAPDVGEPAPPRTRRAWGKVPHEDRYRAQRGDLLRAAARLAARKGYARTRVSDLVAEAGLSKSTFYEHFASKEECFVELYRRMSAGLLQAGIDAAREAEGHPPFEAILAVIRALVGYVEQDPRLAEVVRGELGASEPAIREQRAENIRQITCLMETLGRRLGSPIDPLELSATATVYVHGVISIFPQLERQAPDLDRLLQTLARMACRSFALPSDA
jgi:AcrR family transcriptional regulator